MKQVPSLVPGSTSQHIAFAAQVSSPDTPPVPSTLHVSPTSSGLGSTGKQPTAFQLVPPSSAHGLHFVPAGQSCKYGSQSVTPAVVEGSSPLESDPGCGVVDVVSPEVVAV
ncbi:MAG: hypothetical protein ACRBN8_46550 [Nannocystales bacterium]